MVSWASTGSAAKAPMTRIKIFLNMKNLPGNVPQA
jgi:hypothetical protein